MQTLERFAHISLVVGNGEEIGKKLLTQKDDAYSVSPLPSVLSKR